MLHSFRALEIPCKSCQTTPTILTTTLTLISIAVITLINIIAILSVWMLMLLLHIALLLPLFQLLFFIATIFTFAIEILGSSCPTSSEAGQMAGRPSENGFRVLGFRAFRVLGFRASEF